MSRTGTFRYHFDAGTDRAAAVTLLSTFSRHADLHPLIVAVREKPAPAGVLRRYRIKDRLAVGPVRFPITYTADVLTATNARVVTVARQFPATTLRNDTELSEQDGGRVRADVEITLTAPTLLFPYAFGQARTAHTTLARRLESVLAG